MKQTAVEWLVKKYFEDYNVLISELEFQQAKEMEKEQIIDAYNEIYTSTGEQYYNKKFKKE